MNMNSATPSSSKKSNSTVEKNEQLVEEMDDKQLQALLEEAINYKKPSDIENKSDCFKRLFKITSEEDKAKQNYFDNICFNPRKSRNNRNGGSLQDLQDALNSDQFGNNYCQTNYGTINVSGRPSSTQGGKKHSKRKQSSVSSRQREGGSLPNDVNIVEQFLLDRNAPKRMPLPQPQHTVIYMGDGEPEEKQHLLAHDSLAQSITSHGNEGGTEMKPMCYTNSLNLEIAPGGDLSNVGKSIRATSQAQTITTFITTGTTITSAAISGPKSSTTSSITPSSANNVPMSSTTTLSTYNDVDKGIDFSMIEKANSYQQQNQAYITDTVNMNAQNNAQLASQNGSYAGGALLSTSSGTSSSSALKVDSTPVELQQNYKAVSSIVDNNNKAIVYTPNRYEENAYSTQTLIHNFPATAIPSGGPTTTSTSNKERKGNQKRNLSKYERNVNTFIAKSIAGYRGDEDLDSLLSFIENKDINEKEDKEKSNQKPKNGMLNNSELLNSNENKLKKNQTKNKNEKVQHKLKKCSSLEELSSSNRNNNTNNSNNENSNNSSNKNTDNSVTLRSKSSNKETSNSKKNTNSSVSGEKVQNKRNERRSWGTEELNYLGESSLELQKKASPPAGKVKEVEKEKEKEVKKAASDSSASSTSGGFESLSIVSIEPITSNTFETQEFHVVTKKRKAKRKRDEEIQSKMNSSQVSKRDNYQNRGNYKQHQNSHDYSNKSGQKDGKLNKNRRKSTSSVPPSEKSDDSDLDSVHSLPIKPTKSTSLLMSHSKHENSQNKHENMSKKQKVPVNQNSNKQPASFQPLPPSQISYADMAKKTSNLNNNVNSVNNLNNSSNNKIDKTNNSNDQWPSVSSTNKVSSSDLASFPFNSVGSGTAAIVGTNNNNNNNNLIINNTNNSNISNNSSLIQQTSPPLSKKSSKLSFPELVESNNTKNKLLNNLSNLATDTPNNTELIQNNEDTNNNLNVSEPKKIILYSQSLLEGGEVVDSNGNNIKICPEDVKSNTLHKSKSFEHQSEPFPPLEKTLTKQQSQKSLNDSQKLVMGNPGLLKGQKNENLKKTKPTTSSGKIILSEYTAPINPAIPVSQQVLIVNTAIPAAAQNQNPPLPIAVPVIPANPNQQILVNVPGVIAGNQVILAAQNPGVILVPLKTSASSPANLENQAEDPETQQHSKRSKKEKNLSNGHHHHNQQQHQQSHQRPAVIIMNYPDRKTQEEEDISSITFGFDIDEHLLHSSDDDDASGGAGAVLETNEINPSLVNNNDETNNCDINDKNSDEKFVVNNNNIRSNLSSNNLIIENQSSSPKLSKSKDVSALEVSQSSSDLGYLSSSLITNSTTTPSPNQQKKQIVTDEKILLKLPTKSLECNLNDEHEQQDQDCINNNNNYTYSSEETVADQDNLNYNFNSTTLSSSSTNHNMDDNDNNNSIDNTPHTTSTCTTKNSLLTKEQTLVPSLPVFIQPDTKQSFTFNHEKVVHFVGEEWDKFIRNGVTYFEEL